MDLNEELWNENNLDKLLHFVEFDLSVLNYVKFLLLTRWIFFL